MGTDPGGAWVGALEQFTLHGHPDLPEGRWDVVGPDGAAAGSMARDEGSWPAGETTYTLRDAQGQVLATVEPAHASSRNRFAVSAPDGSPIGTFEQATGTFQPLGLTLRSADDVRLRLDGPATDGVRTLSLTADSGDDTVGEVRPDPAAPGGPGLQGLLVRLSGELTGPARLLAFVAVCCRDLVELEQRRTQGGRRFGS